MGGTALTVTIPWVPPSNMLPNAVTSARTNDGRRRKLRKDAAIMLRSAINDMFRRRVLDDIWPPFTGPTRCRVTVAWGKERTRGTTGMVRWRQAADRDGIQTACKGLYDALQDVGLVSDDKHLIHEIEQVRDPAGVGYTTIALWQEESDAT